MIINVVRSADTPVTLTTPARSNHCPPCLFHVPFAASNPAAGCRWPLCAPAQKIPAGCAPWASPQGWMSWFWTPAKGAGSWSVGRRSCWIPPWRPKSWPGRPLAAHARPKRPKDRATAAGGVAETGSMQTVLVGIIVLAAAVYAVRSMLRPSCGCGSNAGCGARQKPCADIKTLDSCNAECGCHCTHADHPRGLLLPMAPSGSDHNRAKVSRVFRP